MSQATARAARSGRTSGRLWPAKWLLVVFGAASPLLAPACGARTPLIVLETVSEPCVISSTAPGTMHACDGSTASISGTVYDPAEKDPLYNVVVYVPSSTPKPFTSGATCDPCGQLYSGNPIATTLTDANGHFTLTGVPDGSKIPLVLQVGKWRMQLTIPIVKACQDNPQPDGLLRLPKNHMEGDIPNIAVSTGGADTLECLFLRMGIDPAEYTGDPNGAGRIHIFQGSQRPGGPGGGGPGGTLHVPPNTSPPGPPSYQALWDSDSDIEGYDLVFLSCEGEETLNMNQQVLFDYAARGGRVYASHFHYAWFDTGPFGQANLATWTPGSQSFAGMGNINANIVTTLPGGQAFPQGAALEQWLGTTGALVGGELPIVAARHNALVGASNTPSQGWIVADNSAVPPGATQYFTFNTPLGSEPTSQCGQVVYTDIHVGAASNDDPTQPVPEECANINLSPQEKALEFMLYNLSSCITPPGQTPTPPPACVRGGG